MPAPPRIAVRPTRVPDWVREAVVAGGGLLDDDPRSVEALVWADPRDVEGLRAVLAEAPQLRWVQLPWAGVEEFAAAGMFSDGRAWTCGKGVYAEEVAEHALALALAGLRDLPVRAAATSWGKQSGHSLIGADVTILGGGGITQSLLRMLGPLRVRATVVRRDPTRVVDGAVRTVGSGQLHAALSDAAVVFLALALTPETRGIIGAAELQAMSERAWLINVARGAHVVTDDLVTALERGWIAGAALDVTDPEPLPDGHPLWRLPNCLITPHTANTAQMARPVLSARITENVRRWAGGQPLIGLVDPDAGY